MVLKIQNKIREDVNNPELWAQLGDAYMQNDEFDHALIAYSNAEKISGTTPAILGLKATALYLQSMCKESTILILLIYRRNLFT